MIYYNSCMCIHMYMYVRICIQRSTIPTKSCTASNEGQSISNSVDPLSVWLCKSSVWKPYRQVISCIQSLKYLHIHASIHRLVPSTGKTRALSADNCKEIQQALSLDCTTLPQNGVYWVQDKQVIQ